MIPRLEAEESNLGAERIAVGTGATKHAGEVTRRWARQAAGELEAAAPATQSPAMFSPEVLARLKVRTVPTKGKRNA